MLSGFRAGVERGRSASSDEPLDVDRGDSATYRRAVRGRHTHRQHHRLTPRLSTDDWNDVTLSQHRGCQLQLAARQLREERARGAAHARRVGGRPADGDVRRARPHQGDQLAAIVSGLSSLTRGAARQLRRRRGAAVDRRDGPAVPVHHEHQRRLGARRRRRRDLRRRPGRLRDDPARHPRRSDDDARSWSARCARGCRSTAWRALWVWRGNRPCTERRAMRASHGPPTRSPSRSHASCVPYALTGGRTRPSAADLPLEALVRGVAAAGRPNEHDRSVGASSSSPRHRSSRSPSSRLTCRLPLGVVRVLVGDLADDGLCPVHTGTPTSQAPASAQLKVLESVLNGISSL